MEPTEQTAAGFERIIDRFEDAWQRGPRPAIDDHLPHGAGRLLLLVELVHVDLENRLKAGEPARVEDYLRRYPELGQDPEVLGELVRAEWEHRRRLDPELTAAEYHQRFPACGNDFATPGGDPTVTASSPPIPGSARPELSPLGAAMMTRSRYRVLRIHARGGLGEILAARDDELRREVALKRLQPRHAADPESRSRFLREAEITGQLEHPGVVPVYGLGQATDGSPCYAMRLIRGDTFQEAAARFHQADQAGRDPGERVVAFRQLLARFVSVCNTVAFAHSRGVLHRDLKPGNILLGGFGETLVVDWGLAKPAGAAENTVGQPAYDAANDLTQEGAVIGTPAYMSPEQAAGRWDEVGPASDVYSLGATLYLLLTGRAPFGDCRVDEALERARRGDFPAPRQVKRTICPALEAICLKAMTLRPQDRYPSSLALAADVEHWLAGEPVSAWREPLGMRARRWARRYRTAVTVAAVGLVACAALAVVTTLWMAASERAQAAQAREQVARVLADVRNAELERADQERYYYHIAAADQDWWGTRFESARKRLDDCKPELRRWEWHHLARRMQDDRLTLQGHTKEVWAVAYSPDGKRLASASLDGTVKVWDAETGKELFKLQGHEGPVWGVAFSPDGHSLATGSRDRTVRIWDAVTGRQVRSITNLPGEVNGVSYSPDGQWLAAALASPPSNGELRLWSVANAEPGPSFRVPGGASSVAFDKASKRIAAGGFDRRVRVWEVASGKVLHIFDGHRSYVRAVAFSPSGGQLASASQDGLVRLWGLAQGERSALLRGHWAPVWGVAFHPDGKRLASSADDCTLRVWDVASERTLFTFNGHSAGIACVVYSPDGRRLASASDDQTVRVWDADDSRSAFGLCGHPGIIEAVAYSPDGRSIASAGSGSAVLIWDVAQRRPRLTLQVQSRSSAVAFSADGRHLAAACDDGLVRLWEAATGKEERSLQGHTDRVVGVAFSPNSRLVATASFDGTVRLWEAASGKELHTLTGHTNKVRAVAFSPDGQKLASAGDDRLIKIWAAPGGEELLTLKGASTAVVSLAFSPDSQRLAAGTVAVQKVLTQEPGEITFWDLPTGQAGPSLRGHFGDVRGLAFSPDGRRLASAGSDGRLKLWEAAPGKEKEVMTLPGHIDRVNGVAFSPDGAYLASAGGDGTVIVWIGAPSDLPPR